MYLKPSMTHSQKAGFYKYHRYLGLATYVAGLAAGACGTLPLPPCPQPEHLLKASWLAMSCQNYVFKLLGHCQLLR